MAWSHSGFYFNFLKRNPYPTLFYVEFGLRTSVTTYYFAFHLIGLVVEPRTLGNEIKPFSYSFWNCKLPHPCTKVYQKVNLEQESLPLLGQQKISGTRARRCGMLGKCLNMSRIGNKRSISYVGSSKTYAITVMSCLSPVMHDAVVFTS